MTGCMIYVLWGIEGKEPAGPLDIPFLVGPSLSEVCKNLHCLARWQYKVWPYKWVSGVITPYK